MSTVLLFVNPKASQAENSFEKVAEIFRALECEVLKGEVESPADYERVIREHASRIDTVVLGGGDGTLQAAAEALMKNKVPLGIVPLGTANNVARSLGLPLKIEEACRVAAQGKTLDMDVARVNGRVFLSVAGIGLSTLVHDEVPDQHKKRLGSLSYAFQALRMLVQRPPRFRATIECDHCSLQVKALQITVCNGRYYGAHVAIHPDATLSDSLLDLSIIEAKKFIRGLIKAALPYAADHRDQGLKAIRAKTFHIQTQPIMKIDVEGATDLSTPAHFEILPHVLKVRVKKE